MKEDCTSPNARKGAHALPRRRRRWARRHDPSACLPQGPKAEASLHKCKMLGDLISRYWLTARRLYSGNPEALSVMLLTILELWTALDRSATELFPLLLEYQTGFQPGLLDGLVLSKREQLDRLAAVEDYLEHRRTHATSSEPPWEPRGPHGWSDASFAVRYYGSSAEHQRLHKSIDLRANIKYYRDVRRLRTSKIPTRETYRYNRSFLQPKYFAWPLPRNPIAAKAIIFELRVPPVFEVWRQTTLELLVDYFTTHRRPLRRDGDDRPVFYSPRTHPIISRVLRKDEENYRRFRLSIMKEDDFGDFVFYDTEVELRVSAALVTLDLNPEFSYAPKTLSSTLRRWIRSRTHTLNDVLARQCDCPEKWSLDEFRAFGNLRGGTLLQWHNILLQLTIPSLDFGRAETLYLVLQAVNEAGPRSEGHGHLRDVHDILAETRFGHALLSGLEDALDRVMKDWESHIPLYILLTIAGKLLSLSPNQEVQEKCLAYLARIRRLTTDRIHRFVDKLFTSDTIDERRHLDRRILLMAFVCHATFDVGPAHFPTVLSDSQEAALLAETCLRAAEHMTPNTGELDPVLDIFRYRWHRLSYELEPWLKTEVVQKGNPCLDMAIQVVWPAYAKGTVWSVAPSPHEHVLTASSAPTAEKGSLPLQYDLLTGRLVVDGSPLSTLPLSIREHETYRRLFGDHIFRVIPSYMTKQGMRYSATSLHLGHELHFGVFRDEELILRTKKGDTTYELIPERCLTGDFPTRLLEDYAHWLVLGEDKIEFRPLEDAWRTSKDPGEWKGFILSSPSSQSARLDRGPSLAVIDIRSKTARLLSDILRPLEQPSSIHITLDRDRSDLDIDLPRLRMSFRLASRQSDITSMQYKGYVIDGDQHVGTLSGLENKLVLRPRDDVKGIDPRLVIIPDGHVSFRTSGVTGHASTQITTSDQAHVQHHAFWIDDKLGYLRDGGALLSKLFLCYLHATTSHCLPDKLTGRTGTEEALRILNSAAVRSVDRLGDEDIHLLHRIGRISPVRRLDTSRMDQSATWSHLSPVAQHDAFHASAAFVLRQAEQFELHFHQDLRVIKQLHESSAPLARRASARASAYRVSQYGAEDHGQDTAYMARSTSNNTTNDKESQAYRLAKYIVNGNRHGLLDALQPTERQKDPVLPFWLLQSGDEWRVEPIADPHPTSKPEFDMNWLVEPEHISLQSWYKVLRRLERRNHPRNIYKLAFFFAGLIFAPSRHMGFIQLLLVAATTPNPSIRTRQGIRLTSIPLLHAGTRLLPRRLKSKATYSVHMIRKQYLLSLSTSLSSLPVIDDYQEKSVVEPVFSATIRPKLFFDVADLFRRLRPPQTHRSPPRIFPELFSYNICRERTQAEMRSLLDDLDDMCQLKHEREYVRELRESLSAFESRDLETPPDDFFASWEPSRTMMSALLDYVDVCRREVANIFTAICNVLSSAAPETAREQSSTVLPRLSPILLLERLSKKHWPALSSGWQKCLVDYAISLTTLQRAERLVKAVNDKRELARELLNTGHEGWDPLEFPEWLLFEVEAGILIRPVQNRIASCMMGPPGMQNHVMQLNMGEGKSSVIIPMVASKLANGSRLVRVIITKPQSRQMMHSLRRALGGLLGRKIFRMPFSRDFKIKESHRNYIVTLCTECKNSGGVILIQPEHILSFKMSGLEALLNGPETGPAVLSLMSSQHYMDQNSRDIIDESDENFSAKLELVYTMGTPKAIELSPLRWLLVQSVLGLVAEVVPGIHEEEPDKLELSLRDDRGFPRIRILDDSVATILTDRLAQRIYDGGLTGLPYIARQKPHLRRAIVQYILRREPAADDVHAVEDKFKADNVYGALLLLRGLIAGGILVFSLQKRWRVNYGRTYNRRPPTGLAVPYRAKDAPAPRSEYSHPDLVILLTCLSYYYGGLSDAELSAVFERLSLSDGGEKEYLAWIECALGNTPQIFHQLSAINIRDRDRCVNEVFPRVRCLKPVVDYYLAEILFAKEMREYPQKLSESGWSIAEKKRNPTTGFSGTSDMKYLLPLSVQALDLEKQRHTNASVLNCLLRPENTVQDIYPVNDHVSRGPISALELLRRIADGTPHIRVIIDVGAQIMELDNAEVARHWLDMVPVADAAAAIFFDSSEELCVVTRDGTTEAFLTSSYAVNIGACLVFLDEAHTRGTDLRMPDNYRAAVTLGPAVTKDQLVQACMRLRKLGQGQSVVFLASAEIRRKITTLRGLPEDGEINVADVLAWSVRETWQEFQRLIPLWAEQGRRHQRQQVIWDASDTGIRYNLSRYSAERFLESEARTLRERYHPNSRQAKATMLLSQKTKESVIYSRREVQVAQIRARCEAFGFDDLNGTKYRDDQEREISVEVEEVRQIARPPAMQPQQPVLHDDVKEFVRTGVIPYPSMTFVSAFSALADSSLQPLLRSLQLPRDLLVTTEFARTVIPSMHSYVSDAYQRPVQWILTSSTVSNAGRHVVSAVILTPWEANKLLPTIRAGTAAVTLHMFAPRISLGTRSVEDLTLYTTPELPPDWAPPPKLVALLVLFAGQLYFRSYADYVETCRLLGVAYRSTNEDGTGVAREPSPAPGSSGVFVANPVPFFLALVGQIRREFIDISKTDIGRVLAGDVLPSRLFAEPSRSR